MKKLTGKAVATTIEFFKQSVYDRLYYWHRLTKSYGTPDESLNRRMWKEYGERYYAYKCLLQEFGFTVPELEDIENNIVCDFWSTHDA